MSTNDGQSVTVTTEGLTVEKRLDLDRFQTVAVVFELSSDRAETTPIRLIDSIPDEIDIDDIGFHPKYEGDHWSIQDRKVIFERHIDPSADSVFTVYGIRNIDPERAQSILLDEPTIELEEPTDETSAVADPEMSNKVREFLAGETDSLPGTEPPADELDDSPIGDEETDTVTDEEAEPAVVSEASEEPPAEPEEEPTPETDEADGLTIPSGGVARVLANELRKGRVSAADRRTIQDELIEIEGSVKAKIEHLQQRVSDLDAYTDALEAFLDDQGTPNVVDDLTEQIQTLDTRLDETITTVEETTSRIETIEADLRELETDQDQLTETVSEVDDLHDDIADVTDEIADIRESLDDIADFRERLTSVFGAGQDTEPLTDEAEESDEN